MSDIPGGRSLGYVADTVLSITRSPGLGPGDLTVHIAKTQVKKMGNNLEVCSRSKFQRMYHDRGCGERWVAMAPEYSDKASPGDWVRHRWSDRRPSAPDGMVVAAIPAHQLDNEKPQFLILWFR